MQRDKSPHTPSYHSSFSISDSPRNSSRVSVQALTELWKPSPSDPMSTAAAAAGLVALNGVKSRKSSCDMCHHRKIKVSQPLVLETNAGTPLSFTLSILCIVPYSSAIALPPCLIPFPSQCDQTRPACSSCVRKGQLCTYSEDTERNNPSNVSNRQPARLSTVTIVSATDPGQRVTLPVPDRSTQPNLLARAASTRMSDGSRSAEGSEERVKKTDRRERIATGFDSESEGDNVKKEVLDGEGNEQDSGDEREKESFWSSAQKREEPDEGVSGEVGLVDGLADRIASGTSFRSTEEEEAANSDARPIGPHTTTGETHTSTQWSSSLPTCFLPKSPTNTLAHRLSQSIIYGPDIHVASPSEEGSILLVGSWSHSQSAVTRETDRPLEDRLCRPVPHRGCFPASAALPRGFPSYAQATNLAITPRRCHNLGHRLFIPRHCASHLTQREGRSSRRSDFDSENRCFNSDPTTPLIRTDPFVSPFQQFRSLSLA